MRTLGRNRPQSGRPGLALPCFLLAVIGCRFDGGPPFGTTDETSTDSARRHASLRICLADVSFVDGWRAMDDRRGGVLFVSHDVIVDEADIIDADALHGARGSFVRARFSGAGAARLSQATETHLGKLLAIVVNGAIVASPKIGSPVSDVAMISADFSREQANELAEQLDPAPPERNPIFKGLFQP